MRSYKTAMRCLQVSAAMLGAAYGQTKVDLGTQGRNANFSGQAATLPSKTGTSLPATCAVGATYLKTDAAAGKNVYVCTAANVWTVQGIELPDPTGKANQLLTNDGTGFLWRGLSGDISGAPGAVTVTGLNGKRLGSITPLDGQFLKWNGVSQQWEATTLAGALSVFGRGSPITAQTGDYTFAQIAGTVSIGQLPNTGGDLNGTLTGARVTGLQTHPVGVTVPATGQVLTWDGSQWTPQAFSAGGDLSGTLNIATVSKLQNRAVAATAPLTGQVLGWNGSQWTPQTVSGGNQANLIDKTVANNYVSGVKQTFVPSLATSGLGVTPGSLPTSPAAGDLVVDADDANKLKVYDGGQWNTLATSTNYVSAFTGQTSVLVLGTTHRLGTANLLVACYDSAAPASRVEPDKVIIDALTFNVTVSFTAAQTGRCVISGQSATGTGTGGATMASQLGDLSLVLSSPTVLTAGLNCTNASPCNVRLGSTVYSVTTSSTITLSGGSGSVLLYLDPAGLLTAGHNLTLACSVGCTAAAGVGAFPAGSVPLFMWTATSGVWDVSGASDKRAFLSTRNVAGGAGIVTLDTGAQTLVAVDSATVPSYLTSSAVMDFAIIAPGTCSENTFSLPGAAAGDAVAPGWPAGIENGLLGMMRISAANTVAVRVCNFSGATLDPAAATFRATVVRSF